MSDLLAQQHEHEERLRRLALRKAGVGDVDDVGFTGAFARRLYGGWIDESPEATWDHKDGAMTFSASYFRSRNDELIDGPLYLGCSLEFRFPRYISVTIGATTVWDGTEAPEDVDLGGGHMLGGGDIGGNPIASMFWVGSGGENEYPDRYASGSGLPGDHFVGAGYPRQRRFHENVSAYMGSNPEGAWECQVIPDGDGLRDKMIELGMDPDEDPGFPITLHRWGVRFAEDIGEHFTPGQSSSQLHLKELLAASPGFTLGGRSIVIPPGYGGTYRAVGSAEIETITPEAHSTRDFPRATLRVGGTGLIGAFPLDTSGQGVGTATIPGHQDDPDGPARAQASALLEIPDEGGIVFLSITPGDEIDDVTEAQTGNTTDVHVRNAHLGVYRWFHP